MTPLHKNLSIGLEMELQIIDPKTHDLIHRAKELIRNIRQSQYEEQIKPEITQSMIEINSSIHHSPAELEKEMLKISHYLLDLSHQLKISICGGGTHPFQTWSARKIFPSSRFRTISKQYGYLAKRFTVFSMHVHVGCANGDNSIYLTHVLSRYIPQLIALSASSPFYQGSYTGYHSTRVNVVNAFPLSGHLPYMNTWREFKAYYKKMRKLKIIESMKDFYWDVRPKPEFGTVEIRICDMPLTVQKAVMLTAYIQTLVYYLLKKHPYPIISELYEVYDYNRFQASRFGFDGDFIHPYTQKHTSIQRDILETIRLLKPFATHLGNEHYLNELKHMTLNKQNDADLLREAFKKEESLTKTVKRKCAIWKKALHENSFSKH